MQSGEGFRERLVECGLSLVRERVAVLQVNLGRWCDLACRHCHLEAGPQRREIMQGGTVDAVIACARRFAFPVIDLTGGAPERHQELPRLIGELAPLTERLIVRTNLVMLERPECQHLPLLYRAHRVALVASLPSLSGAQTDAQRGQGVWERSLQVLRRLNDLGYGREGSGLELDLVANPAGAFLPGDQAASEQRFRHELEQRHGIRFNRLHLFANMPLGRFRSWLEQSGNLDGYCRRLADSFNPAVVAGVMCRSLLSIDWDGTLYDCDFNIAAGLPLGGGRRNIKDLEELPSAGTAIAVGEHCFGCTAGSGFT